MKMSKEEVKAFALTIVPDGVFDKPEAERWCAFLNYLTDSEAYVPLEITDKAHWAFGQYGVST